MAPRRSAAARRLSRELASLRLNPPANVCAGPIDDDLFHWKATLFGPEGTPYEGGIWEVDMKFSPQYPIEAPKAQFLTKMWHPNISFSSGSICLDILSSKWSSALSVETLLVSLLSMLDDPNPSSPLNSDAARVYKKDKADYYKKCQEYVRMYASME
eukprot:gnl/Chilomastix_cuspidata/402.p2 GENE.gnl/Chilomastix_cuspidata/402~~gnl/Chilomastix_cuspidata/402.p2  ORF type:complete len:157 (-),score=67.05 gnl/Chilomastix_cuspidata/402:454-924(-)